MWRELMVRASGVKVRRGSGNRRVLKEWTDHEAICSVTFLIR